MGTLLGGNQQSASVFVSVDGESSEFFVSGLADIGVSGSGTVSVTNGGAFYPGDLTLGDQMGAKGVGTVDGADSVLSAVAALTPALIRAVYRRA